MISFLFHDVFAVTPSESGFDGHVADRYKVSVAEFARALDAIASGRPDIVVLPSASHVEANANAVTLTVDDGGLSYATWFADLVESHGWRGHCFMTTDMIGRRGFLTAADLRDLDRRGHVIGSHSASHPTRFSACSWQEAIDEWRRSRGVLEDLLGHQVAVASLPGGYLSRRAARAAGEAGLDLLFTSEPVASVWRVGSCTLAGRFTVRRGLPPSELGGLAAGARLPALRQWLTWRVKKFVKPVMGSLYPRLGAWVAARNAQ